MALFFDRSARRGRSATLTTLVLLWAAVAVAAGPTAAGQVPELLCDPAGVQEPSVSTAPIGPHDSTPPEHRATGVPLAAGDQAAWDGPCGTTADRTHDYEANWDHFFFDLTEEADVDLRMSWTDPSDEFYLYLYRGRVDMSSAAYPKCDPSATGSAEPCLAANSASFVRTDPARAVTLKDAAPGLYSVRVIYVAVVEGSYNARVTAPLPVSDPQNPSEPEPPGFSPGQRGSYGVAPSDPYLQYQWGLRKIAAPQAWQEQRATGFGVTIGVIDTGIDYLHPDLSCPGKLLVLDRASVGHDRPPWDRDGHGTHVAGIAGACGGNSEGVIGVAPDATIMPVEAYDAVVSSSLLPGGTDAAFAQAINFAVANGAHVINLSMGVSPPEGYLPEVHPRTEDALVAARDAGVVVVAAAGNFSPRGAAAPSPICGYPALSRYVLCVGATDRDDNVTYYTYLPSNLDRGDTPALRAGVVAPGGAGNPVCSETIRDGIVSTHPTHLDPNCGYSDGYREKDGTSMASPHVAGIAALVYDRLGGTRSKTNAELVIDAILSSADDLYATGWDPLSGHGRVNAAEAVRKISVPVVRPSALSLHVDGRGSSRSRLVATLTDAGSGAGLAEQPIEFFADGTPLGSVSTDEWGVASFPLDQRFRGAGHLFEALFRGTADHGGSSASTRT